MSTSIHYHPERILKQKKKLSIDQTTITKLQKYKTKPYLKYLKYLMKCHGRKNWSWKLFSPGRMYEVTLTYQPLIFNLSLPTYIWRHDLYLLNSRTLQLFHVLKRIMKVMKVWMNPRIHNRGYVLNASEPPNLRISSENIKPSTHCCKSFKRYHI